MPDSPFETLERSFQLLTTGPRPLALPGGALGRPLPDRPVPLDELRSRLLHPSTPYATRDAALNVLVRLSQRRGGAWTVGLAAVLLPGLRRALAPLRSALPDRTDDFQAEMLAGLLEAVAVFPAGAERVASRLTWAAARRGHQLMQAELAEQARRHAGFGSVEPRVPWNHPDLVLARAVRDGVIVAEDAELVGETRIGDRSLADMAASSGVSHAALKKRRRRAEERLVAWLVDGNVPATPRRAGSSGAGRPRMGVPAGSPGLRPLSVTEGGESAPRRHRPSELPIRPTDHREAQP